MTCVQVDIGKRDLRITAKARKKTIPQLFLYSGNVVDTVYTCITINKIDSRSEIKTILGEKVGSWKTEYFVDMIKKHVHRQERQL